MYFLQMSFSFISFCYQKQMATNLQGLSREVSEDEKLEPVELTKSVSFSLHLNHQITLEELKSLDAINTTEYFSHCFFLFGQSSVSKI